MLSCYQEQNAQQSEDIQYKVAHIFDPTCNVLKAVTVVEDSGCKANFVHPTVVHECHLQEHPAKPVRHRMMTGEFQSNKEVHLSWIGQDRKQGEAWAYVAPADAPEQFGLLVGTSFISKNPNVFGFQALPEPALLNVQSRLKVRTAEAFARPKALCTFC